MYCPECGSEIIEGALFCPECGASIANEQAVENKEEVKQENVNREENAKESGKQDKKDPFFIKTLNPNCSSLSSFISSVREQQGVTENSSNNADPYERNIPIVPNCVEAEEDEKVIKQYNIARLRTRLKFMKAEGRLMVTNKRVLFRAAGTSLTGNLLQEHEFNIDEIAGIEIHKDYKFSLLNLIGSILVEILAVMITVMPLIKMQSSGILVFTVLLGMIGVLPTFIVYKHPWIKLLCAGFGVLGFGITTYLTFSGMQIFAFLTFVAFVIYIADLLVVCFVPNLMLKIKEKHAHDAVRIGSMKSLLQRISGGCDEYTGFAEVLPWEDTVAAMNEIGALIEDIKKNDEEAIKKRV